VSGSVIWAGDNPPKDVIEFGSLLATPGRLKALRPTDNDTNLSIFDSSGVCVCVCVCVIDYTNPSAVIRGIDNGADQWGRQSSGPVLIYQHECRVIQIPRRVRG